MKYLFGLISICVVIFANGQIDQSEFLIARNTGEKVVANGDTVRTMGFSQSLSANPLVPGPTLEFTEGDSIEIDMWNVSQGAPHTIHLHGLDVNQENDGVPHLSFEVHHMDHGYYYFKAPHAGTYLYHCHVVSSIHVQGGMYGLIIVHPPDGSQTTWDGGYEYDFDMSLMFSEIDTIWHNDSIIKHEYDTTEMAHEVQLPDTYDPQYYLVNGLSDHQIADSSMEHLTAVDAVNYFRLANIGYKGNKVVFPSSMGAQVIDSDGRPLPSAETSDTVYVLPGERYGVIGTFSAELIDSIGIEYFDLNTGIVEDTQYVKIIVDGMIGQKTYEKQINDLIVYPNPATKNATLSFYTKSEIDAKLSIHDLSGSLVFQKNVRTKKGTNSYQLDLSDYETGAYLLSLNTTESASNLKLIIR